MVDNILSCLLNDQRINCFDGTYSKEQLKKWASKDILLCPACGKPYEYCHGRVVTPYFRHKDKEQCEDRYSEPETEEHIQGKRDLYEWIKQQPDVTDVVLEGWIPGTKQRPDIMFKYSGKQCVIEYQCSPISTEYYERHELYQAAGIIDIWVLGTDKYLEKEENEKSQRFRKKEIENNTNFYYDSEYKIFIMRNSIENIKDIANYKYAINTFYYTYNGAYGSVNRRRCFNDVLRIFDKNIFTLLDNLIFKDGNFILSFDAINSVNKYYNLVNKEKIEFDNNVIKTEKYFSEVFKLFYNKYSYRMNFDYCGDGVRFSFFDNDMLVLVNEYPELSLSKISNTDDKFGFNVNYFSAEQMVRYLYNKSFEYKEARKHYDILNRFKRYKDKNIYLLFTEDKCNRVPENIRFKLIKNYYDDKIENAENILKQLKFLQKINVENIVFMIPYKKIRRGYKVRNYKKDVIEDFYSYGLRNIYFYEDLIKEHKQ